MSLNLIQLAFIIIGSFALYEGLRDIIVEILYKNFVSPEDQSTNKLIAKGIILVISGVIIGILQTVD